MADKITYADKVSLDPKPNPPNQIWRYLDANEVKTVVNSHADDIDENESDIAFINSNIISQTSVQNSDFTINNGDEGTFFICTKATTQIITLNQDATGAIPDGTSVYFAKNGQGDVIIDGGGLTIHAPNNGTSGQYQIELLYGVICLYKIAENEYIISGNLLIG